MKPGRLFTALCKALLLIVLLVGIFYFLRVRQQQDVIDDAADDLKEQVGDTYVPVHVTTIIKKTMHRFVTAYGKVEPAPANIYGPAGLVAIRVPSTALIESVDCIEGQTVQSGQTLITLDRRALQQSIAADESAVESARTRRDQLFADSATPAWIRAQVDHDAEQQMLTLARDKAQISALTLTSPITGIVTQVNNPASSIASPMSASVVIVDLHRLVIALDVTSAALDQIKIGNEAFGTFGRAKVTRMDAVVDPQTGMGSVDIALPADTSLRPGQSISAQIAVETQPDSLVVPAASIVMDGSNRPTIALIDDSGRWAVRAVVQRGIVDGDDVAISGDAVHEGASVVTIGAYGLTDRTRVALLRD